VRVIAGDFRSRPLRAPAGDATRPTSDRLRETLFNILGPEVRGRSFLDGYAGSGAVGIEAWSRGARPVVWIESAPAALRALTANLASLGVPATGVVRAGFQRGLARLEHLPGEGAGGFDYIYLDPPYAAEAELLLALAALDRAAGVAPDGARIIAETRRGAVLPEAVGRLRRERVHAQGDSQLTFFRAAST